MIRIETIKKEGEGGVLKAEDGEHAHAEESLRTGVVRRKQRSFSLQHQSLSSLSHCLCPTSTCNTCIDFLV